MSIDKYILIYEYLHYNQPLMFSLLSMLKICDLIQNKLYTLKYFTTRITLVHHHIKSEGL
jgi:hypothetical protein